MYPPYKRLCMHIHVQNLSNWIQRPAVGTTLVCMKLIPGIFPPTEQSKHSIHEICRLRISSDTCTMIPPTWGRAEKSEYTIDGLCKIKQHNHLCKNVVQMQNRGKQHSNLLRHVVAVEFSTSQPGARTQFNFEVPQACRSTPDNYHDTLYSTSLIYSTHGYFYTQREMTNIFIILTTQQYSRQSEAQSLKSKHLSENRDLSISGVQSDKSKLR